MSVAKEHRGCGIGRRLLHHVVEYAKETGAHNFRRTRGLMYLWNLFSNERNPIRLSASGR